MKIYTLQTRQMLPISLEQAWDFLSDPRNLKVITPEYMGFRIISGADRKMYPGQLIQYDVNPFPGITTRWVTEITHVQPMHYFVDEQRFGPYALWHHKHFITPVTGGVEMEDLVDYKLPFGFLGAWMNQWVVEPQLKKIFEFRRNKLNELFGAAEECSGFRELQGIQMTSD